MMSSSPAESGDVLAPLQENAENAGNDSLRQRVMVAARTAASTNAVLVLTPTDAAKIGAVILVAGLALSPVLNLAGFAAAGITAGSPAAFAMSAAATIPSAVLSYGVASGQSIGAAGLGAKGLAVIGAGTVVTVVTSNKIFDFLKKSNEEKIKKLRKSKL